MVCVCCGCNECPGLCPFSVEADVVDSVGNASASMTPAGCTTDCGEDQYVQEENGNDYVVAAVNKSSGNGVMQGYSSVQETNSSGGVTYTRSVVLFIDFQCVGFDFQWQATAVLTVSDFEETEPFYSGIGAQKRKSLNLGYSVTQLIGCADSVDDITAVANLSGVTINGTSYSWTVNSYSEVCEELDENLVYQPCEDYLEPNVQTLTVVISKLAGC